jgi:hypothetical protein
VEICTVGSVRGESVGVAMVDLRGHAAGNGGYSQGTPTAHRPLSYSDTRNVAFWAFGKPLLSDLRNSLNPRNRETAFLVFPK